ncbi:MULTISPECIES: hypothetical protein [unclassified Streptomyces]|uniref:hypothetical protein n=1 Tax=unclassified Streptomyces TaxID=2593676 RepID=UPI0004C5D40A|nr:MULTISPECIES: hypothetical protein [unclassified Streptomyces]KOV72535.1 hypothetical protein ADL02_42895 [Streptomyces sp. NRRL WC-3723]
MTIAPGNARRGAFHRYRAMRDFVKSADDTLPGKFEITYAVFDPRTGTGAVFTDIHPTPAGPRYATRKDFVYGEDVTIADWTISTEGLPLYG